MLRNIFSTLVICLLLLNNTLYAQFYTYGQDPASQRWRQLKTSHFHLIYPETWENKAQNLAHFLESIRQPVSASLLSQTKPIPVVLRNQTMLSNGFVSWAPKRMEMVTTVPFDNQATDWMKYLSVHEFRHVVQVEAINRSTTGFFSKIFGQVVTGSVAGLHLPLWFLEGDAVLAETSFTHTGRGRLPSFIMPLKSQLLERGAYSYDKAVLGSYRDIVPDHYTLGYHLVAATQSKYGFKPFQEATRQVAKTPFIPGSFSHGIRKVTRNNLEGNYYLVVEELKTHWEETDRNVSVSDYHIIKPANQLDYVDYINPHYIDDDTFIAFRTSPSDIPRLVKIGRNESEEILFTPGYGFYETMSYANGMAAWLEIEPDPRWEYKSRTSIRVLNIKSGKSYMIAKNTRLQSPILSPDGSQIAAVEVNENNNWTLIVFDTESGKEMHRITDPAIDFLMEPTFSDCSKAIIAIAFVEGKGKSIVKTHIENPRFDHLFSSGFVEISEPAINDCVIYFTGTWSGRDELYAWNIDEKQLFRVLASRFGATCASFSDDGKRILFSDFTSTGNRIGEYKTDTLIKAVITEKHNFNIPLYERAVNENYLVTDTIALPDKRFDSQPFTKLNNSGVFHSWLPVSLDVSGLIMNPGFTIFSQDLLGSKETAIGFDFGQTSYKRVAYIDYSVKSMYPVFNFRFDIGSEDRIYNDGNLARTIFAKISAGVSLPLSYNRNAVIYGFNPSVSTSQELFNAGQAPDLGLRTLSYNFSTYAYQRLAYRDLFPRFGISAAIGFSHSPFRARKLFQDISAGQIVYGAALLYMPGLIKHHSFRLYTGVQRKTREHTSFGDAIRLARGYHLIQNDEMLTFSVSYSMPLLYPDVAIGPILYAKRLKTNFFYDYSQIPYYYNDLELISYGIDLVLDVHLLRMPMPFELGLRTMYLKNMKEYRFEFLWGVDFYALGHAFLKSRRPMPIY